MESSDINSYEKINLILGKLEDFISTYQNNVAIQALIPCTLNLRDLSRHYRRLVKEANLRRTSFITERDISTLLMSLEKFFQERQDVLQSFRRFTGPYCLAIFCQ